jgi:hypothetical protein
MGILLKYCKIDSYTTQTCLIFVVYLVVVEYLDIAERVAIVGYLVFVDCLAVVEYLGTIGPRLLSNPKVLSGSQLSCRQTYYCPRNLILLMISASFLAIYKRPTTTA